MMSFTKGRPGATKGGPGATKGRPGATKKRKPLVRSSISVKKGSRFSCPKRNWLVRKFYGNRLLCSSS